MAKSKTQDNFQTQLAKTIRKYEAEFDFAKRAAEKRNAQRQEYETEQRGLESLVAKLGADLEVKESTYITNAKSNIQVTLESYHRQCIRESASTSFSERGMIEFDQNPQKAVVMELLLQVNRYWQASVDSKVFLLTILKTIELYLEKNLPKKIAQSQQEAYKSVKHSLLQWSGNLDQFKRIDGYSPHQKEPPYPKNTLEELYENRHNKLKKFINENIHPKSFLHPLSKKREILDLVDQLNPKLMLGKWENAVELRERFHESTKQLKSYHTIAKGAVESAQHYRKDDKRHLDFKEQDRKAVTKEIPGLGDREARLQTMLDSQSLLTEDDVAYCCKCVEYSKLSLEQEYVYEETPKLYQDILQGKDWRSSRMGASGDVARVRQKLTQEAPPLTYDEMHNSFANDCAALELSDRALAKSISQSLPSSAGIDAKRFELENAREKLTTVVAKREKFEQENVKLIALSKCKHDLLKAQLRLAKKCFDVAQGKMNGFRKWSYKSELALDEIKYNEIMAAENYADACKILVEFLEDVKVTSRNRSFATYLMEVLWSPETGFQKVDQQSEADGPDPVAKYNSRIRVLQDQIKKVKEKTESQQPQDALCHDKNSFSSQLAQGGNYFLLFEHKSTSKRTAARKQAAIHFNEEKIIR